MTFQHLPALKEVLDVSPSEALGPAEVAEARHQVRSQQSLRHARPKPKGQKAYDFKS